MERRKVFRNGSNIRTGKRGEEETCAYLIRSGHTILERNFRCGHLEIDIISLDKDGIHFVEVKSLTAPTGSRPEEKVGRIKQKRIAAAAGRYLAEKDGGRFGSLEVFMDVAAVVFDGDKTEINYFPNAYIPMYF